MMGFYMLPVFIFSYVLLYAITMVLGVYTFKDRTDNTIGEFNLMVITTLAIFNPIGLPGILIIGTCMFINNKVLLKLRVKEVSDD